MPDQYHRGSIMDLYAKPEEQLEQLDKLCKKAERLAPQLAGLGGYVWSDAHSGVKKWLLMARQAIS